MTLSAWALSGASIATVVLGGCTSSGTRLNIGPQAVRPAEPPRLNAATNRNPQYARTDGGHAYQGKTPRTQARYETPAPPAAPNDAQTLETAQPILAMQEPDRHGRLVGLYGDLVAGGTGGADVPATRFDSGGNLVQITAATDGECFDPDVDATGERIVFASTQHNRNSDIYVKAARGRTMTQITNDTADDLMPAFGPDGDRIAFASNRSGNWDIYVTNVHGDPAMQLTFSDDNELHPTWSPDGTRIAYCRLGTMSGQWEIWVIDLDQPSTPQFLTYGLFPQWNPDPAQDTLAFQRARQRGSRLFAIWTVDIVNREARPPTEVTSASNAATMHPTWSPDGSRLAFVTVVHPEDQPERPSRSDIWVVDRHGNGLANLTQDRFMNLYPAWAKDGSVYFVSNRSGVENLWAVSSRRTSSPTAGPEPDTGNIVSVPSDTGRLRESP